MSVTRELRPALRSLAAEQRATPVENGARHRGGHEIVLIPWSRCFAAPP